MESKHKFIVYQGGEKHALLFVYLQNTHTNEIRIKSCERDLQI